MTRYEIALIEFESATAEGEHEKLIYAYFGAAIYYAQCLEESFSMMLWINRIFKEQAKSSDEINEIIDAIENSKKTMGSFLNEVKQNYELSENHIAELESVLNRRNYLVHKYFKLEIQKFHSDKGKKEMLKYFADFIEDTVLIDDELQKYFLNYKIRLGFTEDKIAKLLEKMKQKELQRDLE